MIRPTKPTTPEGYVVLGCAVVALAFLGGACLFGLGVRGSVKHPAEAGQARQIGAWLMTIAIASGALGFLVKRLLD